MTVIAVTGASGYVGRLLCEALDGRPGISRVIGVDVTDPAFATRNLEFYRLDVRSPSLAGVVEGADVLVHLAFILGPGRDASHMHDVNVNGTRNVLDAATRTSVRRLVHVSSVMAYGAHPDNDFPLTESSPIRGVAEFPYSAHKAECEQLVSEFAEANPDVRTTILRPAVVSGPRVAGFVAKVMASPVSVGVEGYDPPFQAVHHDDVTRAVLHVIDGDLTGAYNVAPDDWIDRPSTAGRKRIVGSHEEIARRLERAWTAGLSDLPAGYLPFLMYPWVMSNAKLRATGFAFEHSSADALSGAAEALEGWVSVGPVRFRPRRVALGVATAALVAGSLGRGLSRRRSGRSN